MQNQRAERGGSSSSLWDRLEDFARDHIQQFMHAVLAEEGTELLGRKKSVRRVAVDVPQGSRKGHGKPRKRALMSGTLTVRRPRVRGLADRFVSRVLPLIKRRTKEVRDRLPQLYLHGLELGDCALALRGLLGDAAPLSPASLQRLKTQSQLDYAAWKRQRLEELDVV